MPARFYSSALAAIHQQHFESQSPARGQALVALLRRVGVQCGRVVDLACGPGGWARELTRRGSCVTGVDISPAMVRLARKRAPRARFLCADMAKMRLPACAAVTGFGEPFNYLLRSGAVRRVLRNTHQALRPGGVLMFDTVEPPRGMRRIVRHRSLEFRGVRMEARIVEEPRRRTIEREMAVCSRDGRRCTFEKQRGRMYSGSQLAEWLRPGGLSRAHPARQTAGAFASALLAACAQAAETSTATPRRVWR